MAADLENNPQPDESLDTFDDSLTDSSGDTELEQYGVWVKVAPEDVAAESSAEEDFDLENLSTDQMDDSALLTEEEEQLLGNLEDGGVESELDTDLGNLSDMEIDDFGADLDAGLDAEHIVEAALSALGKSESDAKPQRA